MIIGYEYLKTYYCAQIIIIMIFIYSTSCEFFSPVLAGEFSQQSEWLQVSSSPLDSSKYSGQSQECCCLNGLDYSSNFHLFWSPFQSFEGHFMCTNYKLYPCYLYFPQCFNSQTRSKYLFVSLSFISTLWYAGTTKFTRWHPFLVNTWSDPLAGIWWSICLYLKIQENFMCLILQERFWFVYIPFGSMVKIQFFALFPMNHLPHPVMSCLIFFGAYFQYLLIVINGFVSITAWSTLAILLHIICFPQNIIGSYDIVLFHN